MVRKSSFAKVSEDRSSRALCASEDGLYGMRRVHVLQEMQGQDERNAPFGP
jgi:hypothetical protein